MGLFQDVDLSNAADDPFGVPDGAYDVVVTEVKVGPTRNGDKVGMTTTFKIESDDEHNNKTVQRWLLVPQVQDVNNPTADEARALSFLKSHLISLGVPAEEVNTVEVEDIVGREFTVKIVNRDGYTNVRNISERVDSDALFG